MTEKKVVDSVESAENSEAIEIGNRIKKLLVVSGMTQKDLVDKTGLNKGNLSRVISGKIDWDLGVGYLSKVAAGLEVPVTALQDDDVLKKCMVEKLVKMIPEDLLDFVVSQRNIEWVTLAKDLSEKDFLTPDIINDIVKSLDGLKEKLR